MEIGTAIFLSSLVLAFVVLYIFTRDRWRWGRIMLWVVVGIVTIGTLSVAVPLAIYYWNALPGSVRQQTEYAGLRIGMTQDEVKYVKGYPPTVYGEAETNGEAAGWQPVIDTKKLEQGKKVEDYREWAYEEGPKRISITFDKNEKKVAALECYSADKFARCPTVGGVADGHTEQQLLAKLGAPDSSRIDGVTKHVHYTKLGMFFLLTKEQVYMLGINNARYTKR